MKATNIELKDGFFNLYLTGLTADEMTQIAILTKGTKKEGIPITKNPTNKKHNLKCQLPSCGKGFRGHKWNKYCCQSHSTRHAHEKGIFVYAKGHVGALPRTQIEQTNV
jgi:hypothetical protein